MESSSEYFPTIEPQHERDGKVLFFLRGLSSSNAIRVVPLLTLAFEQRTESGRDSETVSPLTYVRPGLPPILMIQGDADPLVPYAHSVRLHFQVWLAIR